MLPTTLLLALSLAASTAGDPPEWGGFRGNNGSGISNAKGLPERLSVDDNAMWRTDVPSGYSSPVVANGLVFVTGAEGKVLATMALDAQTGDVVWRREVAFDGKRVGQNSSAAPSPVTDGEVVVAAFHKAGLIAYDMAGELLWHTELGEIRIPHGLSTSPLLHGDHVVLLVDQDMDAYLAAYDRKTGEQLWKTPRTGVPHSYSTPSLYVPDEGPAQVVVLGALEVSAYSIESGERVWWSGGSGWMTKCLPVFTGDLCIVNAHVGTTTEYGVPKLSQTWDEVRAERDSNGDDFIDKDEYDDEGMHFVWFLMDRNGDDLLDEGDWQRALSMQTATGGMFAIKMGGEGDVTETGVAWTYDDRRGLPEVPSPVIYDDVLYMMKGGGIFTSMDPASGEVYERARVGDPDPYYASPIAADGKIFLASQSGQLSVLRAGKQWEVLSVTKLGEEVWSTPAIADGSVFVRSMEALYCFQAP